MANKDEPANSSAKAHTIYMVAVIIGGLILNVALIAWLGAS